MMRAKRQRDRKAVASFQQLRQERQEGPVDPPPKRELPQKEEEEEDMVETVEVRAAGTHSWVPEAHGTGNGAAPSPHTVCGSGAPSQLTVCTRGVWRRRQEDSHKFKASRSYRVVVWDNQRAVSAVKQLGAQAPPAVPAYAFDTSTWAAQAYASLKVQGQPVNSKSLY